jgi:hypothetical protein
MMGLRDLRTPMEMAARRGITLDEMGA